MVFAKQMTEGLALPQSALKNLARLWRRMITYNPKGTDPSTSLGMTDEVVQVIICHSERSRGICPLNVVSSPCNRRDFANLHRTKQRLPLEGKLSPKVTDEVSRSHNLHLIRRSAPPSPLGEGFSRSKSCKTYANEWLLTKQTLANVIEGASQITPAALATALKKC